jgi:hypothetical protein
LSHFRFNTYHCQILKRSRALDVLQCSLQILQFLLHHSLCLLSGLDSSCLEALNSLDLSCNVHLLDLVAVDALLDLINDGAVLELAAVGAEVDGGGLRLEDLELTARIVVALFEGQKGVQGVALEAESGGEAGPVDLGRGGTLVCY